MKVSREQAARNRERVVETAGRLFRERGIDGIGIADLMRESGMTHGGFYGQFDSKDALAAEAVRGALGRSVERWKRLAADNPDAPLAALARDYLSSRHRDNPGAGCVMSALAADVGRRPGPLSRSLTEGLEALVAVLDEAMPGSGQEERRRRALAAFAQMAGAVMLSRAVDDPALSDEILDAAIEALEEKR